MSDDGQQLVPSKRWQLKPTTRKPQPTSIAQAPPTQVQHGIVTVEQRTLMVPIPQETKWIMVGGVSTPLDPAQMMRMIKNVTQSIGEHKRRDDGMSQYVVPALRKARSDMVSDLESHFGLHWEVDEATGKSSFYV